MANKNLRFRDYKALLTPPKNFNHTLKELLRSLDFDVRTDSFYVCTPFPTSTLLPPKGLRNVYLTIREIGLYTFFSTMFEANT